MEQRQSPVETLVSPTLADTPDFGRGWAGRRVLVTGHTGFKGSWLSLWLHSLGAEVTGFALHWEGQRHGALWMSGDTVLYDGVRQVARRLDVGTALMHLGGVRFPLTGPVRYTMTAAEAVELCRLLAPRTVIPVHYEGWHHFHESRATMERHLAAAPEDIRDRFRLLPAGTGVDITL